MADLTVFFFFKSQIRTQYLGVFYLKNGWFYKVFTILVKWDPLVRIFWPKWNLCLRILGEKVTHLGSTSPYALTCEYPPPDLHTSHIIQYCCMQNNTELITRDTKWEQIRCTFTLNTCNLFLLHENLTEQLSVIIRASYGVPISVSICVRQYRIVWICFTVITRIYH